MNLLGSYKDIANHMHALNKLKEQLYHQISSGVEFSSGEVDILELLSRYMFSYFLFIVLHGT